MMPRSMPRPVCARCVVTWGTSKLCVSFAARVGLVSSRPDAARDGVLSHSCMSRLDALLAHLQSIAVHVIDLLIEWDENGDGKTDRSEFVKALPVLEVAASRAEGRALFDALCAGAEDIAHWALFRKLADAPGVDVQAAEAEAREQLAARQTRSKTARLSPFWQRSTGSKSVNLHALRKRNVALTSWQNGGVSREWTSGLRSSSSPLADSEIGSVNARQLQGVVLNGTATVQQQLLAALDEHLARVIGSSPTAVAMPMHASLAPSNLQARV